MVVTDHTVMARGIFIRHDGTKVRIGLGTIKLAHEIKIGPLVVPAGEAGDLLEINETKDTGRCWFTTTGAWVALADLEPAS